MRRNHLNVFDAIYKRITAETVKDAIIFSNKLVDTRALIKKRYLDIPQNVIPEKKLKLERSIAQKSQPSFSFSLAVCSTKKYVKTLKKHQRWITSKQTKQLMNSH